MKFPVSRLDGKCFIRHRHDIHDLNKFKDFPDTYYVSEQLPKGRLDQLMNLIPLSRDVMPLCSNEEVLAMRMSKTEYFLKTGNKLRALEIFAGAGGLAAGMHQSEAIDTCWAVEIDKLASKTFQRNFPNSRVYNHDANVLLRQAIEEYAGQNPAPIFDEDGERLPRMPRPGEVDFLYGGPPCQDFSICNRFKKANSIKNSLLTTYLSYVDFYRPKYFLLENVTGLLKHRLGSTQVDAHNVRGGIENGSIKFILRTLTSLGYQCGYSIIQAGQQGTPQNRSRVIIWGSQPGFELPQFPEPTHIWKKQASNLASKSRYNRQSAPHKKVSIGDAISDLPAFDWKVDVTGEKAEDRAKRLSRDAFLDLIEVDHQQKIIGHNSQRYPSPPLSEYQRLLRQGVQGNLVENHFTRSYGQEILERVLKIPMRPGANHLDLPAHEDVSSLRDKDGSAPRHRFYPNLYARLDFDKVFDTCLTKVDPQSKNGRTLHPNQHRIITVREYARAMGFPDTFTWDATTQKANDMYKQIGNAVAVPVGRALGKELLAVMIRNWERDESSGRPLASVRTEISPSVEEAIEEELELLDRIHLDNTPRRSGYFDLNDEHDWEDAS